MDPKLSWALANRGQFPMDVNRAPRELLLRVPGLGVKVVDRIIASRRSRRIDSRALQRMGASLNRVRPFVITADWSPGALTDSASLRARLARPDAQLALL
jgi:predicted DNA-binding helix-hairpin-helix protein